MAAPSVGLNFCLSAGLGPCPLTTTRTPSPVASQEKAFHPRSHPDGGSESMALLGLPAGAKARARALVCDSSSPGYQAVSIPCPLPAGPCPPQCLVAGPFCMVPITMMTLRSSLQGALCLRACATSSPCPVSWTPPCGLRRVNTLHGTAPPASSSPESVPPRLFPASGPWPGPQ